MLGFQSDRSMVRIMTADAFDFSIQEVSGINLNSGLRGVAVQYPSGFGFLDSCGERKLGFILIVQAPVHIITVGNFIKGDVGCSMVSGLKPRG